MLKLRMQGTVHDLEWFRKFLEQQKEIQVLRVSEIYANKGTKRFFRMYAEIERVEGYEDKEYESLPGIWKELRGSSKDSPTGEMAEGSGIFSRRPDNCNLQ